MTLRTQSGDIELLVGGTANSFGPNLKATALSEKWGNLKKNNNKRDRAGVCAVRNENSVE